MRNIGFGDEAQPQTPSKTPLKIVPNNHIFNTFRATLYGHVDTTDHSMTTHVSHNMPEKLFLMMMTSPMTSQGNLKVDLYIHV